MGTASPTDFALTALSEEKLGQDDVPDFLAISFSSSDLVGHEYGVNSKEVQDIYLRLDLEIKRLLDTLDQDVGAGQYVLFLTSDHGASHVTSYLQDLDLPAGVVVRDNYMPKLNDFLEYRYGTTDVLEYHTDDQIFLDHKVIANLDLNLKEVQHVIANEILSYEGIERVYTAHQLNNSNYEGGIAELVKNGYSQKSSGDVFYILKSGHADYASKGSSHGTPYAYDTHVPLIFFGKGIKPGSTVKRTEIPDIAPTISALLGIAFPSGMSGEPISEVLD